MCKKESKFLRDLKKNKIFYLCLISIFLITTAGIIISFIEKITFGDALWWSFVTFTTVGYGDVVLKTQLGKLIAGILMIFGVGIIGLTTTSIAVNLINDKKEQSKQYENIIIEQIKIMIDNYDSLSNQEIEFLFRLIRSLKNNID